MNRLFLCLALGGPGVVIALMAPACSSSSGNSAPPNPSSSSGSSGSSSSSSGSSSSGSSSGGSSSSGSSSGGSSSGGDAGDAGPTTNAANVLTCSQVTIFHGLAVAGATWSLTGPGALSSITTNPSSVVYIAPTSVPVGPDAGATTATVTYGASTSTLDLATAFLAPQPAVVPIPSFNNNTFNTSPFEHRFASKGSHVYAAFIDPGGLTVNVYASTDYGTTFASTASYAPGQGPLVSNNAGSATVAVDPGPANPDAGNDDVVYLAYTAYLPNGVNGFTTRLAVSTDSAKTFTKEYVIVETTSPGNFPGFATPDVVSPSPGNVIVTSLGNVLATPTRAAGTVAFTFASGNQGADIGPPSTTANLSGLLSTNTNNKVNGVCNSIDQYNATGPGVRVFSNGQGYACILYHVDNPGNPCTNPGGLTVQCSMDSGGSWSAPTVVGQPQLPLYASAQELPTGAMSYGGNIAVTWVDTVTTDGGDASDNEVWVATSSVAAQMAGQPFTKFQYPKAFRVAAAGTAATTALPVVLWQGDQALWLSQTVLGANGVFTLVDKTCDNGVTWSGWVNAGPYTGSSLFATYSPVMTPAIGRISGMGVGGWSQSPNQVVAISLANNVALGTSFP